MSVTISNPPYNMKWKYPFFYQTQPRFDLGIPPENNANFAFVLTALEKSDSAIFLLPNGVLSSETQGEKEIRKNLVRLNILEAVVLLPERMFEATNIPTVLLVFDKNKSTRNVQMIDLSDQATAETREQRGQAGKTNTKRVYSKEINVLSDDVIKKVEEIISNQENETPISKKVSIDDIEANDFNLQVRRYVQKEFVVTEPRSYDDIVSDLNRIIDYKNSVKITINENMAKDLGIYGLAMSIKDSKGDFKELNGVLSGMGLKVNKEDVLSVSRNKELKFEVKNFNRMPEIIILFFNMWRQQFITLNNEQNRLLAELRDTLLVDLMSGKISIDEHKKAD